MTDAINPSHYKKGWSDNAELISITENLNFNRGNAVKYIARAGRKNPAAEVEDLKKALWYLQRELDRTVRAMEPNKPAKDMIVPGGGMFPFVPVSSMKVGPAMCDTAYNVAQDAQGKPVVDQELLKLVNAGL